MRWCTLTTWRLPIRSPAPRGNWKPCTRRTAWPPTQGISISCWSVTSSSAILASRHWHKLSPASFCDGTGQGWRLDGDAFATPLLEAAIDMGIKHVAIHKALWLPPAPREAFNVDDLGMPLDRFPTLTFEIVHAGTA